MKEIRFFYVPDAATADQLPEEEAQHCLRVLRLQVGDEIMLMDGAGTFYRAEIINVHSRKCFYQILESEPQPKEWAGWLHLALAPTKNLDRIEWLAEKATEIGFDELSFLNCKNSERKVVKTERIDKILISAVKQSRKGFKPLLNEMTDFRTFLQQTGEYEQKFIAHCYDERDVAGIEDTEERAKDMGAGKAFLYDVLQRDRKTVVLIGPEGDFSLEEVRMAVEQGFVPVSLGKSRLRTETAALVAVHMMHMKNSY